MGQPFLDPGDLRGGNERQRAAFAVLDELALFARLADYGPVLAGTVPLAIDVAGSDLDILCRAANLDGFAADVETAFATHQEFALTRLADRQGAPAVKASFAHGGFTVELFGQARPVSQQHGYRHMVVEARLLEIGGEPLRDAVIALKRSGLKTEPAFARLLGLAGDAYEALLTLEASSDDDLRRLLDDLPETHGG